MRFGGNGPKWLNQVVQSWPSFNRHIDFTQPEQLGIIKQPTKNECEAVLVTGESEQKCVKQC